MNKIYILSKIKSRFPKGYLFFIIFLISKLHSSLIISLLTKYKSQNESLYFSFFIFFTFFSQRCLGSKHFQVIYELLCFAIYILTIIIIIYIIALLAKNPEKSNKLILFLSNSKKSKRRCISIVSVVFTITAIISGYLIEILSLPICFIIIRFADESNFNKEFVDFYLRFLFSLKVSFLFYLIMNIIIIILLNCFVVFYVKLINNVHLSNKRIISFTSTNASIIVLVFAQNIQSVHYYFHLFNAKSPCIISLNCLALVYFLFANGVFIYQVTSLNFSNLSIFFAYLFCFFGSIISIVYNTTNDDATLTSPQIYFQLLFQVVMACLGICLLYLYKTQMFQKKLPSILFKYNRKFNYNYIAEFMMFIKGCFSHVDKFSYLFSFIMSHQESCGNTECDCNSINITELRSFIRGSKIERKLDRSHNVKSLLDIILIIENVFLNYIHSLAQNKELCRQIHLIVYHCNYVYYFKRNYIYSLYIIDEYLSQLPCMPFEFKVHLHSFKKKVLKSFNKKAKRAIYEGSYIVKCNKFALYYNHLLIIRNQIDEGSKFYAKILNLKRLLCECKEKSKDNSTAYHSQTSSYIKLLFINCKEFNIRVKEIKKSLHQYYNANDNETIFNQEIDYLLTNFFVITNKVIPNDIIKTFITTNSYYQLNNIVSYYSEVQFIHPMILSIKSVSKATMKSDDAKNVNGLYIEYVSQQLLDILGYKKSEIIEQEIKKLIPQFFAEKQTNIIQSQFFIQKKVELELIILLITKDNYFKRALGVIGSFPTLLNHVLLICNIDIVDDDSSVNRFRFVLDVYGKVITFSENFSKKYWLTYQMVNKLNISFSSLFGINMEKLCIEFKETIHQIKDSEALSIEKYINILSSCKLTDFIAAHSHKTPSEFIKEEEEKTFIMEKKRTEIKRLVYCIRKEVEEKEVEANWLSRFKSLESSLINDNNLEASFNFEIMLQHIGNIPYFIAVVTDYSCIDYSLIRPMFKRREMIVSEKNLMKFNIVKDFNNSNRKICMQKNQNMNADTVITKNTSLSQETMDLMSANQSSTLLSLKEIKPTRSGIQNTSISNIKKEARISLTKAQGIVISLYDKFLFIFLEILSCSIIIVCFFQIAEQLDCFNGLEEISTLSFNSIFFKEMYLDTVSYYSSLCLRLDGLEPTKAFNIELPNDELVEKIISSSSNLLTVMNSLLKTITSLKNQAERQKLFIILYDIIPFKRLKRDWLTEEYDSSVENEISMIHYHMGVLRRGYSEICRVREIFLKNPLIDSDKVKAHIVAMDLREDEPSIEEILFFGYLLNSIKRISKRMDIFLVKIRDFQRLIREKASSTVNQFNIASISLMLGEIVVFTLLILSYQKKIIQLLFIFITKTPRITYQEIKMAAFIKVISSFDEETCSSFENVVFNNSTETEKGLTKKDSKAKTNASLPSYTKTLKESKSLINTATQKERPNKVKEDDEEEKNDSRHKSMTTSIQLITINFGIVALFW